MMGVKCLLVISLVIAISLANPLKNNKLYEHCYKPCPSIYLPVCGFDGYKHNKFASECNMEVENCILQVKKSRVYMKTALDLCEEEKKCSNICTREYKPICGFNGDEFITFANDCVFEYENCKSNGEWRRVKAGHCNKDADNNNIILNKNCDKICTLDYNPVCGNDGTKSVSYGNMCSYEVANCYANYHLRLLRTGEC